MMRFALIFMSFMFTQALAEEHAFRDMDGGWHEAIIVTRDAKNMTQFFETVAGWETIKKGKLSAETAAYLTNNVTGVSGVYAVVKSPDFDQGWVRIIELGGVDQKNYPGQRASLGHRRHIFDHDSFG